MDVRLLSESPLFEPPASPIDHELPLRSKDTGIASNKAADSEAEVEDEGGDVAAYRCICGADDEDGKKWIQCEFCKDWQHLKCVKHLLPAKKQDLETFEYLCDQCDPSAHEAIETEEEEEEEEEIDDGDEADTSAANKWYPSLRSRPLQWMCDTYGKVDGHMLWYAGSPAGREAGAAFAEWRMSQVLTSAVASMQAKAKGEKISSTERLDDNIGSTEGSDGDDESPLFVPQTKRRSRRVVEDSSDADD